MAKEKNGSSASFWKSLFQVGVYKATQGRVTRQLTFAAMAVVVVLGNWRLHDTLRHSPALGRMLQSLSGGSSLGWLQDLVRFGVPGVMLMVGLWLCYRTVNFPRFADFLVAVEAEMNKVSWPSRGELFRSSIVVIVVIFSLAAILFGYDLVWRALFRDVLGILH